MIVAELRDREPRTTLALWRGMRTTELRLRFLSSLAASGALVGASLTACGGAVDATGQSSGPNGTSGSSGGSPGSSSGDASTGHSPPLPPTSTPKPPEPPSTTCTNGKPQTACYTHQQLIGQLGSPPRGGDSIDAGAPDADTGALFDVNGCLPANLVEDTCCNPAITGPTWTGTSCCYVHCAGACCGRPFVVGGQARVAAVRERHDWMAIVASLDTPAAMPASGVHRSANATAETALDSETRARIATAWAHDASMEHASVASFARFTLELLALGAPADLVVASVNAGRDEIEHAVACFAIASRFAGKHLGPAPLDVGGATPAVDLASIVGAAIVEGCIGETLSALLAEARLALAEDDEVRAALRRIAHEEACHAELAWRFVGWAITSGGEAVREAAARAFTSALACAPQTWDASLRGITPDVLRAHGLLDEATAREVGARAFSDVIAPCAAALTVRASAAA